MTARSSANCAVCSNRSETSNPDRPRLRKVRREDIILQLATAGISMQREQGASVTDAGRVLSFIQLNNSIDGAAPLIFGKPNTVVDCHGRRVLNTSRLRMLEPAPGKCGPEQFPFIYSWLQSVVRPAPGLLPYESLMAWIARYYRALREGKPALGQAAFLCGPPNCGKTLLSVRVMCPLFGNRMANPYDFLTGKTAFTDNLFESGLWVINDEESPNERSRNSMLSKVKSAVVNTTHEYHAKFGKRTVVDATNVQAWARGLLLEQAKAAGVPAVAIVLDVPEDVYSRRNALRERRVEPEVLQQQAKDLRSGLATLRAEGFDQVHVLTPQEEAC